MVAVRDHLGVLAEHDLGLEVDSQNICAGIISGLVKTPKDASSLAFTNRKTSRPIAIGD